MTSTEFTAGIGDSARVSSKVLKPPGGGSSDIFGFGNSNSSDKASANDNNTHSRLFGNPSDPPPPVPHKKNTLHQSSIFENGHQPPPTRGKKAFVRRNPITGEVIGDAENDEKTECDNEEVKVPEETASAASKNVQTSIRVSYPPGGKSSGIF